MDFPQQRKPNAIISESAVESLKSVTSAAGGVVTASATSFLTISALFGISMSFLAKFF